LHAIDEAVHSKDPSLRVLDANRAQNVRGPDGGDERHGQVLNGREILLLVGGRPADPEG
jgi:hypothetical protein